MCDLPTKPKVVFVLGAPGAGKGTQCTNIVNQYGFVHLSAGDLLREERNRSGSQYGELIEKYIRDGQIVPVEITCALLENAMTKHVNESGKHSFLIDGFPRNQNNLEGWTQQMAEKVRLLFVLFFECSEEESIDRCLKRGQAGSGRSDDNMESLRKRFQTFNNETMPIVEHYRQLNLVQQIDGTQHPDTVFEKVKALFDAVKN